MRASRMLLVCSSLGIKGNCVKSANAKPFNAMNSYVLLRAAQPSYGITETVNDSVASVLSPSLLDKQHRFQRSWTPAEVELKQEERKGRSAAQPSILPSQLITFFTLSTKNSFTPVPDMVWQAFTGTAPV